MVSPKRHWSGTGNSKRQSHRSSRCLRDVHLPVSTSSFRASSSDSSSSNPIDLSSSCEAPRFTCCTSDTSHVPILSNRSTSATLPATADGGHLRGRILAFRLYEPGLRRKMKNGPGRGQKSLARSACGGIEREVTPRRLCWCKVGHLRQFLPPRAIEVADQMLFRGNPVAEATGFEAPVSELRAGSIAGIGTVRPNGSSISHFSSAISALARCS